MNDTQKAPNLDRPSEMILPTRLLRSPYFVLRTPIGGYYLDTAYNQNMVRRPDGLAQFLADAQRAQNPACELGEVKYSPRKNQQPLRYLHEGAIKEFEEAATRFLKSAPTSDHALLRQNFKLPDPAKEPDAYWVCGERFAPQLMILWGCEKEQFSSLPLVGEGRTVCSELRSRAMSWLRLFREGVELSRFTPDGQTLNTAPNSLGNFLAFPVLDATGNVTHIDHLSNGQYTRTEVTEKTFEFSKARRLTKLPGSEVDRFAAAAKEFYRAAHPAGCGCVDCAGKPSTDPGKKPGVLSYQQELRQGFRLPDPDIRPDAFYVIGPPHACKLFVLCPHPAVKDAEDIEQNKKHVEWQEKKARTPEETQAAQKARQQFEAELAQHNLYKRYFYGKEECLCLTSDTVLGIPVAAPTAVATTPAMTLPSPASAPAPVGTSGVATVVQKLMARRINWTKVMAIAGSVAGVVLALIVAAIVMWPRHLDPVAYVTNDKTLDPSNARNVIVIDYNNRLGKGIFGLFGGQPSTESCGKYYLRHNGLEVKLSAPKVRGVKGLIMQIEDAGRCIEDGATNYLLNIEKAHDVWGNNLTTNNVPVVFDDKRSPSLLGGITTVLSDNNDMIRVDFDEPMNQASVENVAFYSISGPNVTSIGKATMQKDRKSVVLQADKPFQSSAEYWMTFSSNIVDAARAANRLRQVTTNFTYAMLPLAISGVSATEVQTRLRVEFNKPVDGLSAKGAFKIDKLQVGEVNQVDAKTLEIVLTNSAMLAGTQYSLQIQKLKDTSAGAAGELATNVPFSFTGTPDAAPAELKAAYADKGGKVILKFSKPLRKDLAEKATAYALTLQGKDRTETIPLTSAALVGGDTVQLFLKSDLDKGDYTIKFNDLQDLVGNRSTGSSSFTKSRFSADITSMSELVIDNDLIKIQLSGRIDMNRVSERNFRLEYEDGRPAEVNLSVAGLNPGQTSLEVILKTSPAPNKGQRYQLHCTDLKLMGDSRLQEVFVYLSNAR